MEEGGVPPDGIPEGEANSGGVMPLATSVKDGSSVVSCIAGPWMSAEGNRDEKAEGEVKQNVIRKPAKRLKKRGTSIESFNSSAAETSSVDTDEAANIKEPTFLMDIEPKEKLVFAGKMLTVEPVSLPMKLINTTKNRQAFKVKCTSNKIFRVNPPWGFCEVGETTNLLATFWSPTIPEDVTHYFVVYHKKCTEKDKNARELFACRAKADGVLRLRVYFDKPPPKTCRAIGELVLLNKADLRAAQAVQCPSPVKPKGLKCIKSTVPTRSLPVPQPSNPVGNAENPTSGGIDVPSSDSNAPLCK